MPTMRVYWNSVDVYDTVNLKQFTQNPNAKSVTCNTKCRGVIFRTIFRQEMDFSGYLESFSLETDRRSRDAGDPKLLFCPKPETEKSIGVLKIVRPKRFTSRAGAASYAEGSGKPVKVSLDPTSRADTVREFEVLLESTDFILEDVQEQMAERFQLQETFGDLNVFFFGKRAEIFTYSGTLMNAGKTLAWRNNFLYNYENYLRGTRCAELKARAYLLYDDVVREGFILSAAVNQNSTVEAAVKFNFTLLVTNKRILTAAPENVATSDFVEVGKDVKTLTPDDFEFIRSSAADGGLPWVTPLQSGNGSVVAVNNFVMSENNAIEGNAPKGDLQQVIINRSMEALKKARTSGEISEDEQILDYEVLVDFVTSKQLAGLGTTSQQMAGKKSTDVENQTGEVIVAQLISDTSDPTESVNNLTLRNAVKAADSMASQYNSTLGDEATHLKWLAQYFATGNELRMPKLGPNAPYRESTGVPKGQEDTRYVLATELDSELMRDITNKTVNITAFNAGTANKGVVESSKVAMVDALMPSNKPNKVIQYYAASFCLIEDPSNPGLLIGSIAQKFPGAFGYGGKNNAVAFVKDQKISKLQELMQTLPQDVRSAVNSALGALKASPLYTTIKAKLERPGVDLKAILPLGESIFYNATRGTGALSPRIAKFLSQAIDYVGGITQENYLSWATTSDLLGGTLKGAPPTPEERYFTTTYASSLDPGADSEYGAGIVTFGFLESLGGLSSLVTVPDGFGGVYAIVPYGRTVSSLTLSGSTSTGMVMTGGYSNYDEIFISIEDNILSPSEKTLLEAGVVRVTSANYARASQYKNTEHYVETQRRKATPIIKGQTENKTGKYQSVGIGHPVTSAFSIKSQMFKRLYGGGNAVEYKLPTESVVTGIFDYLASSLKGMTDTLASDTAKKLSEIVAKPEILDTPEYRFDKEAIISALAVSNYTSVDMIQKADIDLKYMGVTADSYLDLSYMVEIQRKAVENLSDLKYSLAAATAKIRGGETEPAMEVRNSDGQEASTCG